MVIFLRGAWCALVAAALLVLFSCATVSEEEYAAVVEERDRLATDVAAGESTIRAQERDLDTLQRELVAARQALAAVEGELTAADADLALGQTELDELESDLALVKAERDRLSAQVARLSDQVQGLQAALVQATEAAAEEVAVARSAAQAASAPVDSPADPLAEALAGRGGFQRVAHFGFISDPQAANRRVLAPAIAVDTSGDRDILYDTRLDYGRTAVFLTIEDPESRAPSLRLITQYATESEPLWAQTAFIAIEGLDPVDPIDPIVLNVEPARQTDGSVLVEQFAIQVDRAMVNRLSSMLSSRKFTATFVGRAGEHTHRPSIAERAAMSNILFAYIDLGGLK